MAAEEEEKKEEQPESEENVVAEIKEEKTSEPSSEAPAEAKDDKEADKSAEGQEAKAFIEYTREASELKKNKKIDRVNSALGNNLPKKVKLTNPTYYSLIENFQSNKYKDIFAALSTNVGMLRDRITKEAKKEAEEKARREFGADEAMKKLAMTEAGSASADDMKKAANLLTIELERKLADATNPEKIIPIFENLQMGLTNSRKHKIEFKEGGQIPRAIMIPALLKKSISIVGGNPGRYAKKDPNANVIDFSAEVALANGEPAGQLEVDSKKLEKKPKEKKKRPKWESAFGDLKKHEPKKEAVLHNEDVVVPLPTSSKVTKGELRERRTLAEAGESLSEIEKLKRTIGTSTPFSDGLIQREKELKKVIGDITGVVIPEAVNVVVNKNTDFQNDLDRLLGVTEAPTREEHAKNQMKYESYFNDPDFLKQIERQKLEGVLYDMNTPEFVASIDMAERVDNERRARKSMEVNMEILDDTFEDAKVSVEEKKDEVIEEAPTPKEVVPEPVVETKVVTEVKAEAEPATTVVTEVKAKEEPKPEVKAKKPKKTVKPDFSKDFSKFGILSSKKIKKMHAVNILPLEARKYAKQLDAQNMSIDISESAKVEAERLNTLNQLIDGAREQASMLYNASAKKEAEDNMIKASAMSEAKRLFELNKLIDGAHEQARMLYESNKVAQAQETLDNELKASALSEAKRLFELNKILDAAKEQARLIYNEDLHEMIVSSAQEEAQRLNELNKLLDGAYEQAQLLYNNNKIADANQAQAIEEARLREMEEKKAAMENPVYVVTDARSRYAQIVDFSKPIKLKNDRYSSFRANAKNKYVAPTSYKDTLISLREELNDFEDSSEITSGGQQLKMVA